MNQSFDGKSFKRTANSAGEKTPVVGVSKPRAIYTAAGGETSLDLNTLSPAITYHPGQNILSVKRSTVPVMMSGIQFTETSPTSISFSTPLTSGEKVEIIKELSVVSVMAVKSTAEIYTTTATAGQTVVKADFFWIYNQNLPKTRGAIRVEVNGIAKERGIDYTEISNGLNAMTSSISFNSPLAGGEFVALIPAYQTLDTSIPLSQTYGADITDLKDRVETLENAPDPTIPVVAGIGFSAGASTSSTALVEIPDLAVSLNTTGRTILVIFKASISAATAGTNGQFLVRVRNTGNSNVSSQLIIDEYKFDTVARSLNFSTTIQGLAAGTYEFTIFWASLNGTLTRGNTITNVVEL